MRVLYVDDDWNLAGDMMVLMPPEIALVWAPDSRSAIEFLFGEERPDVVILDLDLPPYLSEDAESEGLCLLDLMRSKIAVRVPVVVLSRLPKDALEKTCIEHGADAYLEKPCSVPDLVRLLKNLVEGGG